MTLLCCSNSYGGKDLADGSFNLEFSRSTVHVAADHVGHWLQKDTEAANISTGSGQFLQEYTEM